MKNNFIYGNLIYWVSEISLKVKVILMILFSIIWFQTRKANITLKDSYKGKFLFNYLMIDCHS